PPPLLVEDGRIEFVNVAGGPALGILEESYYVWQAGALEGGDACALLSYTDGLIEGRRAPGSVERFGTEALREAAADLLDEQTSVDGLLDGLLDVVRKANGQALSDDVAILYVATSNQPGLSRRQRRRSG